MLHLGRCSTCATCNASVWSPKRWSEQGLAEVQLTLVDVKKVHLNARCDEKWWVELADECEERGTHAKLSRWLYIMRKAAWAWEDDKANIDVAQVQKMQNSTRDFLPSRDASDGRRAR